MLSFQEISSTLITISQKIISLIKQKTEFAKYINYQISDFFSELGVVSKVNQLEVIQKDNLSKQFSPSYLRLMFNQKNRAKAYITTQDLCDYLKISKQHLRRSHTFYQVHQNSVLAFCNIIAKEITIECELVSLFKNIILQKWFVQVDFFSNGYIDTSGLYQFLLHYSDNQPFEEYNALLVIKMIKKFTYSDKLFLQDIKEFIEAQVELKTSNQPQNDARPSHKITSSVAEVVKSEQLLKHSKKYSEQFNSFQSQIQLFQGQLVQKSFVSPKRRNKIDHPNFDFKETASFISNLKSVQENQPNLTFQERLIKYHARNEKYIKQIKRQMTDVVPICTVQVRSHMRALVKMVNERELIDRLQLLGTVYNNRCTEVRNIINQFPVFCFLNAFYQFDVYEENSVNYEDWMGVVKNMKISVTNKKIFLMFNKYSKDNLMDYSYFLKIFKLYGCQREYQICVKRQALIYDKWSNKLFDYFKDFMAKMMRFVEEEQIIKQDLKTKSESLQKLFQNRCYQQEYIQLIGQQFTSFIKQHYFDSKFNLL